jgi:hypothetical protein
MLMALLGVNFHFGTYSGLWIFGVLIASHFVSFVLDLWFICRFKHRKERIPRHLYGPLGYVVLMFCLMAWLMSDDFVGPEGGFLALSLMFVAVVAVLVSLFILVPLFLIQRHMKRKQTPVNQ